MEKDTVLLSVKEYNELRDFKKEIENECSIVYTFSRLGYSKQTITRDKYTKELLEELKLKSLSNNSEIQNIKKMSILQFIKWRIS